MANPDEPISSYDGHPDDDDFLADDAAHGDYLADDVDDDVDESFDEIADSYRMTNTFNEEIENVSASDWNIDADALWGSTDETSVFSADAGAPFDFPI